ncbi:putative gamma-glutamyl cyclotransferase [Pseudomonas phage clash]|nr:putative gamma-glutamyl cyclotransferase [Pseudomonas phage clash]QIQ67430.1 putative gamma-glutamyl cyclotransferase [Pseudomonas phage otherone]
MFVFVYGTLMHGFGNHCLLEGARFVGHATSQERGRMYSCGGFPILSFKHREDLVTGEVWELPGGDEGKEMLNNLDRLEGYPGWYDRSPKNFRINGEMITALVYHQDEDQDLHIVEGADWSKFVNKRNAA